MKIAVRILATALLFLFSLKVLGQSYQLSDFAESPVPATLSAENYDLNNNGKDFSVSIIAGRLHIAPAPEYNPVFKFPITEGTLLAINKGEWGGGLFFKPNDSTKNYYVNGKPAGPQKDYFFGLMVHPGDSLYTLMNKLILIKSGNERFIFNYKDSLYFLEGLAHLSLNSGALYRLKLVGNQFTGSKITAFPEAPMAMCIVNDTIFVATTGSFYILNNLHKELFYDNLFWQLLFPNSIAYMDDEHIFVGLRGGYARVDLADKKLTFYKYRAQH